MASMPLYNPRDGSPDEIDDPVLSELYAYWSGLRRRGETPARGDIDPGEIRHLLPYLILAECHGAGRIFRYRLVGTDVAFARGSDFTGRYLHERGPMTPYLAHLCELYRLSAPRTDALYSVFSYDYAADHGPRQVSRLFMPLRAAGNFPAMLLIGQVRTPSPLPIWLTEPTQIHPLALFAIKPETAK